MTMMVAHTSPHYRLFLLLVPLLPHIPKALLDRLQIKLHLPHIAHPQPRVVQRDRHRRTIIASFPAPGGLVGLRC